MRPLKEFRLLIAESRDFSAAALATLEKQFRVDAADLDRAGLLARIPDYHAVWVRVRTMIDAEILDAAPKLRWIATNTTGLNHIDLAHATGRGVHVVSLRGETEFLSTIRATAEYTLGLTLALLRRIPAACEHVRGGGWDRDRFRGREIAGATAGIIGCGRLGKQVARMFADLGARVLVHDRRPVAVDSVEGVLSASLDVLLAQSDIVSLHASDEPGNRHMMGRDQFARMKSHACFINTARGELVDESALVDAIERGELGGAALDVIEREHADDRSRRRLFECARGTDRLLITPHIGGNTFESTERTEVFLAQKLCNAVSGNGGTSQAVSRLQNEGGR